MGHVPVRKLLVYQRVIHPIPIFNFDILDRCCRRRPQSDMFGAHSAFQAKEEDLHQA